MAHLKIIMHIHRSLRSGIHRQASILQYEEKNWIKNSSSNWWRNCRSRAHLFMTDDDDVGGSVTSKKLPNVYKSCPKRISIVKWKILTPLQKLPKNNYCPGLWKVAQNIKIALSGHTDQHLPTDIKHCLLITTFLLPQIAVHF